MKSFATSFSLSPFPAVFIQTLTLERLSPQVLQTRDKENDELTDALRESADEMTELQNELDEVKDLNSQITEKLEEHLNAYEQERAEKDADITANNEEIQAVSFFRWVLFSAAYLLMVDNGCLFPAR